MGSWLCRQDRYSFENSAGFVSRSSESAAWSKRLSKEPWTGLSGQKPSWSLPYFSGTWFGHRIDNQIQLDIGFGRSDWLASRYRYVAARWYRSFDQIVCAGIQEISFGWNRCCPVCCSSCSSACRASPIFSLSGRLCLLDVLLMTHLGHAYPKNCKFLAGTAASPPALPPLIAINRSTYSRLFYCFVDATFQTYPETRKRRHAFALALHQCLTAATHAATPSVLRLTSETIVCCGSLVATFNWAAIFGAIIANCFTRIVSNSFILFRNSSGGGCSSYCLFVSFRHRNSWCGVLVRLCRSHFGARCFVRWR